MKPLILPLLLFLSLFSHGQEPPKKASKIIVLTKDTDNTLLNKITLALFERGFAIDTKDEALKLLTTKERPSKKYAAQSKIQARITDTSIVFTSTIALSLTLEMFGVSSLPTFDPVTYSGSKKSPMREAWNEMAEVAALFGNEIVYSK
jgi:hypothetical protein